MMDITFSGNTSGAESKSGLGLPGYLDLAQVKLSGYILLT